MFIFKQLYIAFLFSLVLLSTPNDGFGNDDQVSDEVKKNITKLLKTNSCVRCNLIKADLDRAELSGADLRGANLEKARFFLANLAGANLQNSNLKKAEFGGADISGADFRGANITETSFAATYRKGSVFKWKGQRNVDSNTKNSSQKKVINVGARKSIPAEPVIPDVVEIQPIGSEAPPVKKVKPVSKAIINSR